MQDCRYWSEKPNSSTVAYISLTVKFVKIQSKHVATVGVMCVGSLTRCVKLCSDIDYNNCLDFKLLLRTSILKSSPLIMFFLLNFLHK